MKTLSLRQRAGAAAILLGVLLLACVPPGGSSTTTAPPGTDPPPATTNPPPTTEPPTTIPPTTTEPGSTTTTTVPPLVRGEPVKEWTFAEFRGDALEEVDVDDGIQVGGPLEELRDYGPTFRDSDVFFLDGTSLPPDNIATGQIASTPDGVTYWVGAEAPAGNANIAEEPVGGRSHLRQTQSFIKRSEDASLSFTVSAAFIETTDLNAVLNRPCPEIHEDGLFCDLIKGEVFLDVEAFTVPAAPDIIPFDTFFHVAGGATVNGYAENWDSDAWSTRFSQVPLWDVEDFDFVIEDLDGNNEGLVLMILRTPRTFDIDLSSVDVGQAFTLQSFAMATAYNRIAGPPSEFGTSATAFLRDPQGIDGTSVTFSGLEPIDAESLESPPEEPLQPPACPDDVTAEGGTLQFSADQYTIGESNQTPVVRVTRAGGTAGPATATITMSDGTATAGVDYAPVNASVVFAAGDDEPRAVEVPVIPDQVGGEGERTLTITLSEPGGCAELGSPATTQVTIRDDDPAPPVVQPFGLDPTFGDGGKATSPGFGGDRSAMALQPDGKIVMVGGTFTAFVMARFNADGTLDETFGDRGKVTTDIGGDFAQEEALGVAVQPDDRIVVAGYTDGDELTVLRYLPDGELDDSFGTDGIARGLAAGIAHDVTIQDDGRILVAGRTANSTSAGEDFSDLLVARLLDDGGLDGSFGLGGLVTLDVGGLTNEAQNVVVDPDGDIVVSGSSPNPGSNGVGIDHHTDIVRLRENGEPDGTFGTAGVVTLDDAFVGADLASQSDGRLLLVGSADTTPDTAPPGTVNEISVVRLDGAGEPDGTFGDAGTVNVPVTALTSSNGTPGRDAGMAVALQPDGRIVVAGGTLGVNPDFAIARLLDDGTLDTSFTDTGVLSIDLFRFTDLAESVAVAENGDIIASGLGRQFVDGYGIVRLTSQQQ